MCRGGLNGPALSHHPLSSPSRIVGRSEQCDTARLHVWSAVDGLPCNTPDFPLHVPRLAKPTVGVRLLPGKRLHMRARYVRPQPLCRKRNVLCPEELASSGDMFGQLETASAVNPG